MPDLFEMKIQESPIPLAMDMYFEQLRGLIQVPTKQKFALTSNLVTFPLVQNSRLFNKYVARSFSDRAIELGSPEAVDEVFTGPANINDRYSHQYKLLLDKAMHGVELELSDRDQKDLRESREAIEKLEIELADLYDEAADQWDLYKKEHYPGKTEEQLVLESISWMNGSRLGRRLDALAMQIDRELAKQERLISRVGDENATTIYTLYSNYMNSLVYLPKSSEIEALYKLDEIKLADPRITRNSRAWADPGAVVDPIIDFDSFLTQDGSRGFDLHKDVAVSNTHDREWSATASFRYSWFFSTTVNVSEHRRLAETLSDTKRISFNFKRIDQVWISRGDWYSSSLFDLEPIKKILKKDKKLAAILKYSVSSVIIGRGMSLKINFGKQTNSDYFFNRTMSGSAKILNIFPVGRGSVNDTTTSTTNMKEENSVLFQDGDLVTRLLGLTVDDTNMNIADRDILNRAGIFVSEEDALKHLSEMYDGMESIRFGIQEEKELVKSR